MFINIYMYAHTHTHTRSGRRWNAGPCARGYRRPAQKAPFQVLQVIWIVWCAFDACKLICEIGRLDLRSSLIRRRTCPMSPECRSGDVNSKVRCEEDVQSRKKRGKRNFGDVWARSDVCRRHTWCRRRLEERAADPGAKAPSLAARPMSLPAKELSIMRIFF